MKKSLALTIAAILMLAVASYFVLTSEPPSSTEQHDEEETQGDEAHSHESSGEEHGDHQDGTGIGASLGEVTFHDDAPVWNTLRLAKAGSGVVAREIELPGEVVLNADKVAHVVPRFAGITLKVFKNLGDAIDSGEVLAVVQSNESVASYEIKSLIAGTVVEKHITLGEFVRDDADIFVVADLSTVWVQISVYARYLQLVRPGQQVHLTASGVDVETTGRLDYIGSIVGERTRTGMARVVLSNPRRIWQPGIFLTARIAVEEIELPLVVPDDAIQTIEGETVVFVKENDHFEVRAIEIGRGDGRVVEVLAGLSPGEEYVAADSYIFKAEFGKSEAGHEH